MLHIVLLMVGVTHTWRVVEICYVAIRRTTGYSRLSIRPVIPSRNFL